MAMKVDLTKGNILNELIRLAVPIMATSLIQMAYNLTDMLWLGRKGSLDVAAVGTAGFFVWFGFSLILLAKVGGEVGVAQSIGARQYEKAGKYATNSFMVTMILGLLYGCLLYLLAIPLISFFKMEDSFVNGVATSYLKTVSIGTLFTFLNPVLSGVYNGSGNSKTPFFINCIGLVINMVFDPILIFGLYGFPALGAIGAAMATVFSQCAVTIVFILSLGGKRSIFKSFRFFEKPDLSYVKSILKLGIPVASQSASFTIFAMLLARIITRWGPVPIAVQKVGAQIEAISWMTANGFSTALSAFVGQNYGARLWPRIQKGYIAAISSVSVIGLFATCLLVFFAKPIFSVFIPEKESIRLGIDYLQILGLSQLFMCLEITTAGAFNGLGRTTIPSAISIIFTGLRVPAAMILSSTTLLGLNGVWWSISMSSVFKGVILFSWFIVFLSKTPELKGLNPIRQFIFSLEYRNLRDKR